MHLFMSCSYDTAIDCGPLKSPDNGLVRVPGTLFSFAARYSCDIAFKLVGFATRVCQQNGEWSGDPPVCERKTKQTRVMSAIVMPSQSGL